MAEEQQQAQLGAWASISGDRAALSGLVIALYCMSNMGNGGSESDYLVSLVRQTCREIMLIFN